MAKHKKLEHFTIELQKLRGGADSYRNSMNRISITNYSLPGYNYDDKVYEKHVPLNNYTGPGTWVEQRWAQKGIHGTNPVDEQARHHDIQYQNLGIAKARGRISQQNFETGIQNSDNQLLRVAWRNMASKNPLTQASAVAASTGIALKKGLQYTGLMNKAAFIGNRGDKPYINEDEPKHLPWLPSNYLQGNTGAGKIGNHTPKISKDRLHRLKKVLK